MSISRPAMNLKSILATTDSSSDDNWMLSYIDVFVLMTTLFLMLMVMNKPLQDAQTMNNLSEPHTPAGLTPSPLPSRDNESHSAKRSHEALPTSKPSALLAIERSIEQHGIGGHVELSRLAGVTRLEISSKVLFDSGDAYLSRAGEALLEKLLPALKQSEGNIVIEGHTDNQAISTLKYPSNWSLAAARATEVLEFYVTEGLDQKRFRAISFGDTQPIAPNNTELNRSKNRRVSLLIEHTKPATQEP